MKDVPQLIKDALGTNFSKSIPALLKEKSSLYLKDGVVIRDYEVTLSNEDKCNITVASPAIQKYPYPVIAAHQTNFSGSKEVFGLGDNTSFDYGLLLAQRGHKVYAIDLRWTGNRQQGAKWDFINFRKNFPSWSPLGADCQDMQDVIFLMRHAFCEQLPFNFIGHSRGGVIGSVLAALEPPGTFAGVVCNASFVAFPDLLSITKTPSLELYFNAFSSSNAWLSFYKIILVASDKAFIRINCYEDDEILPYPLPTKFQVDRFIATANKIELACYSGQHDFPKYAQINSSGFLERQSNSDREGSTPYFPGLSEKHNVSISESVSQSTKKILHFDSFGCIGINTTEHGCSILSALIERGLPPKFVLVAAETDEHLECSAPYFGRKDWLSANTAYELQKVVKQNTFAGLACAAGIPVLFVPGLSSDIAVKLARDAQVDIIFLAETPILRGDILAASKKGLINFHAAPLPRYRGANATLWAFYHDEPLEVWAHFVDAEVDAGDLICSFPLPVFRSDDIARLTTRSCQVSASLAVKLIHQARGEGVVVTRQEMGCAQRFIGPMPSAIREECSTRMYLGQYSFYAEP